MCYLSMGKRHLRPKFERCTKLDRASEGRRMTKERQQFEKSIDLDVYVSLNDLYQVA